MRKFKSFTELFNFSKKEKNGIFVLSALLLSSIAVNLALPLFAKENNTADEALIKEIMAFENSRIKDAQTTEKAAAFSQKTNVQSERKALAFDKQTDQSATSAYKKKKKFTVMANTADSLDLVQIKGIGPAYAKRIIKYREQLGGFVNAEQLMEVYGIDSLVFSRIKDAFVVDEQNITKMNVNTVDLYRLKNHPYIDYYQAKEIIKHREKYGTFESIDEIRHIHLMDENTFQSIKIYLTTTENK